MFRSKPPIIALAHKIADSVVSADFSCRVLRFRNTYWSNEVGLEHLSDAEWLTHFADFQPLPDNLPEPLAMRYHGHQFGTYNSQLGDGRGFLFAQLRDKHGRLLDLGTKGTGQTPWSRNGDGRLTLKGGVREILAATYLEALGVNTSKPFSLIETNEQLHRNDEPSPARGSVFVRLSHSHIRFGTFQRLAYLEEKDVMAELVAYCVSEFYPEADTGDVGRNTASLLQSISIATGTMIGQWMAAGFVHGVMNTDNFNITGETFDFGPWRFLPVSDPNFVAAYFDEQGLYRFGRQPVQGSWALQQLASALLLLNGDANILAESLKAYEPAYRESFIAHTHALLGLVPTGQVEDDVDFLQAFYGWMSDSQARWPQVFFDWHGGEASVERAQASPLSKVYASDAFFTVKRGLLARSPSKTVNLDQLYFQRAEPVSLLVEDVEALWTPIAESDDWSAFEEKLAHLEEARQALALSPRVIA